MKGLAIWGLVFSLAFTGVAGVNSSCRHESRTSAIGWSIMRRGVILITMDIEPRNVR